MKKVAKLVIVDSRGKYLMMYRSNHPTFGNDPDLPGGTLEVGEESIDTMVREVLEEAGIQIDAANVQEMYAGTDYSTHGTHYSLYMTELVNTPEVVISWEHSGFEWLEYVPFLEKARSANDTYMHMVYSVLHSHRLGAEASV
jgi:8-oxo-dGTP pyrophosphatase MutT (NUDIX family)